MNLPRDDSFSFNVKKFAYINCNAMLGDWLAVASRVAAACCRICAFINELDSSAISASRSVEREDTRLS